ncbi:hypothetical protein T11_15591 [Trichinella zimbabwensis]|uniref:Integrase catalytic domain-containing protein n=1 Tax=Trichinella zimbabwensis TaxID=268475 RepID=A0A0V1HIB3_9BILA|nr:hypothetical protein T11_15591 [Trichinella zimbabwensis]
MVIWTLLSRFHNQWPKVWPVRDIIATTMARTFFNNWIARFSVPSRVTTDRDKQIDSNTWATLNKMLLGCRHIRSST